jgi:hypothetical protein
VGRRDFETPKIVEQAIKVAEDSDFSWMDHILLRVLHSKRYSETLQSLEVSGGWEYVLYLFQYEQMQDSIKEAWDLHQLKESKNKK